MHIILTYTQQTTAHKGNIFGVSSLSALYIQA